MKLPGLISRKQGWDSRILVSLKNQSLRPLDHSFGPDWTLLEVLLVWSRAKRKWSSRSKDSNSIYRTQMWNGRALSGRRCFHMTYLKHDFTDHFTDVCRHKNTAYKALHSSCLSVRWRLPRVLVLYILQSFHSAVSGKVKGKVESSEVNHCI